MTKVAGFLCGLGAESTQQGYPPSSLYPAHDFDIGSDGILDHDDVDAVNDFSYIINTLLELNAPSLTLGNSAQNG